MEAFKIHLINEEKSEATVRKYLRDIDAFAKWAAERELTKQSVLQYKTHLTKSYAPSSVNSVLSSLNSFFNTMSGTICA